MMVAFDLTILFPATTTMTIQSGTMLIRKIEVKDDSGSFGLDGEDDDTVDYSSLVARDDVLNASTGDIATNDDSQLLDAVVFFFMHTLPNTGTRALLGCTATHRLFSTRSNPLFSRRSFLPHSSSIAMSGS